MKTRHFLILNDGTDEIFNMNGVSASSYPEFREELFNLFYEPWEYKRLRKLRRRVTKRALTNSIIRDNTYTECPNEAYLNEYLHVSNILMWTATPEQMKELHSIQEKAKPLNQLTF